VHLVWLLRSPAAPPQIFARFPDLPRPDIDHSVGLHFSYKYSQNHEGVMPQLEMVSYWPEGDFSDLRGALLDALRKRPQLSN
jgi:hypothetical protein